MTPDHHGAAPPVPLARIASGIDGLDVILMGGFLKGGTYLVMAPPGAGKTVLANQLAFHHVRQGGRVVYVTLLAESHTRMFGHLQSLRFFDLQLVTRGLVYLGAYATIEKQGMSGFLSQLQQTVRKTKPSVLILDGAAVANDMSESPTAFKKLVHQLNAFTSTAGCTTFLLSSISEKQSRPEHTMADGIIAMTIEADGMRAAREIEVRKFRGSDHLHGRHYFRISEAGVQVYPRLESLGRRFEEPRGPLAHASTQIAELDAMLGGGLVGGSTSVILGGPGAGKTVLGLHFLKAGVDAGEPCLYFGFYEDSVRLLRKAKALGMDFEPAVKAEALSILWQPPLEHYMDALAEKLLDDVRARKVTRLFIDSIDGLRDGGIRTDRMNRYMIALTNELRSRGVTTLIAEENPFSRAEAVPASAFSAAAENILCLRQVEHHSRLSRVIFLIKVREGDQDSRTREFEIVPKRGIVLGQPLEGSGASPAGRSRARAHAAKPNNAKTRNQGRKLPAKTRAHKSPPPVAKKATRRP